MIANNNEIIVHNREVDRLIKRQYTPGDRYTAEDIQNVFSFLNEKDVFRFRRLDTGLFPAASTNDENQYTGYSNVWVRDNIYVAYSHYLIGEVEVASRVVLSLVQYFQKHRGRFENIIDGLVDPKNVMERPHIRFNGNTLEENDQIWEHAQNDALGYFVWFTCLLIKEGHLEPTQEVVDILAPFPLYFQRISYWEDEDSGHWEEARKVEASSIGVVIAGLKAFNDLYLNANFISKCCQYKGQIITVKLLDDLIAMGLQALLEILPAESIQAGKSRRYDSALLFLIYPLQIVEGDLLDQILQDVISNLQGDYGIFRYLGDSFWCRDYRDLPEEIRTSISKEREDWLQQRGKPLVLGEEAQWCIFDSIISSIYGMKYQQSHQDEDRQEQIRYLNRALGQITGEECDLGAFRCPELYYLQNGEYIPNDSTPLLWTQANLMVALKIMEDNLS